MARLLSSPNRQRGNAEYFTSRTVSRPPRAPGRVAAPQLGFFPWPGTAAIVPIGLDLSRDWSKPIGSRYQHGFSTRSGNDGKQPARFGQCGDQNGRPHSRVGRAASRVHDRYIRSSALPNVQPGDRPPDQHPLDLARPLEDGEDPSSTGSLPRSAACGRRGISTDSARPARPAGPGSPAAQILDWAQQASLPVGCLSEPAVLRTALEALTFRLDGSRAAANTIIRKRVVLHGALGYAAECGLLPDNPLDSIAWRVPHSSAALDPAVVASSAQVSALLDAVARTRP